MPIAPSEGGVGQRLRRPHVPSAASLPASGRATVPGTRSPRPHGGSVGLVQFLAILLVVAVLGCTGAARAQAPGSDAPSFPAAGSSVSLLGASPGAGGAMLSGNVARSRTDPGRASGRVDAEGDLDLVSEPRDPRADDPPAALTAPEPQPLSALDRAPLRDAGDSGRGHRG